jgi:hypothetical protein
LINHGTARLTVTDDGDNPFSRVSHRPARCSVSNYLADLLLSELTYRSATGGGTIAEIDIPLSGQWPYSNRQHVAAHHRTQIGKLHSGHFSRDFGPTSLPDSPASNIAALILGGLPAWPGFARTILGSARPRALRFRMGTRFDYGISRNIRLTPSVSHSDRLKPKACVKRPDYAFIDDAHKTSAVKVDYYLDK